jgi:HPt (histidine-containing phosphotransfer) domain-containing protein
MVSMFIEKTPESLEEMSRHYQQKELVEVGKIAHKLKSSINLMGIDSLHQSVRIIEKYAMKNENHEDLPDLLDEFTQTCYKVLAQLKEQFNIKS